ncbi:uncharacterized protein LOC124358507 [Homalodisca vitripennis]|uniref:uncharacterized protein LOC124358507 n=1 Tax=Homalodisca vitripennis TaxID=197043 RepID=UPI001EEC75BF|nr:uncharacterized protein LOC124358507 [Homalodisca vitripennis]
MPRKYKRTLGSRPYANYSSETLEECLRAIRSKEITQRAAEETYGIPRSTIKNKLAGKHSKPKGGTTTFTAEEEKVFEEHLVRLNDFGFPVSELDFRFTVKAYLDKKGIKIGKFKDNLPGYDWAKGFLNRHPLLSTRFSKNIKKVRAQVNAEVIDCYMENLAKELDKVPPSHIFNYDKTNLTDNPGNVLTAESEEISPVGKQKSIPKKKRRKSLTPSSSSEDEPEIPLESEGESETFSDCELGIDSGSPMTTGKVVVREFIDGLRKSTFTLLKCDQPPELPTAVAYLQGQNYTTGYEDFYNALLQWPTTDAEMNEGSNEDE